MKRVLAMLCAISFLAGCEEKTTNNANEIEVHADNGASVQINSDGSKGIETPTTTVSEDSEIAIPASEIKAAVEVEKTLRESE